MAGRLTYVYPEGVPAHWNSAIPFAQPIRWGLRPVPNAQSVGPIGFAQLARKYNPPGSGSVQPYVYPDGPYTNPFGYLTANPAALTPGGENINIPREGALGGIGMRSNPCGCGDLGDALFVVPGTSLEVTPKCLIGLGLGFTVGWFLREYARSRMGW